MPRNEMSFESEEGESNMMEEMSVEQTMSMTEEYSHGAPSPGVGLAPVDEMNATAGGSGSRGASPPVSHSPIGPRGAALTDDTTTMNGGGETQGDQSNGLGIEGIGEDNDGEEEDDEEEGIEIRDGEGEGFEPRSPTGESEFTSEKGLLMEDYDFMVGDVTCCCKPTGVSSAGEACSRTRDWFLLNKEQIMSGFTVGLNLIPAVSSSALMAGLSPILALQATWMVNIITSLIGGSPGMVSGTTGFVGLALIDVVRNYGVPYIFWTVLLAGLLQIAFGLLGLGAIMRLVPKPLMTGFKNGMGILLIATQFRYCRVYDPTPDPGDRMLLQVGHSWKHFTDRGESWVHPRSFGAWGIETGLSFLICVLLPKATRVVPSTLVALVVVSALEWAVMRQFDWASPTVGDYADITGPIPGVVWLDYQMPPLDMDTFRKIYLHSLGVFGVSLMESLLTLNVVGELNEVNGLKNRVAFGQGMANVIGSVFGGMGSAGMVGQSMIANKADGITWLSTFLTGTTVLIAMTAMRLVVNFLPLGAFAGIMFYAAHNLLEYNSLLMGLAALFPERIRDRLRLDYKIQRIEVLTMLVVTVLIVIFDLSIAVVAGVLMAVFVFVWDSSARVVVEREPSDDGDTVTYNVSGPLFFATAQSFLDIFPIEEIELDPEDIIIMLEGAEVHDSSGMFALKKLHDRFVAMGKTVALSSLSPTSRRIMEKFASTWEGVSFLEVEEIEDEADVEMGTEGEENGI